MSKRPLPEAWTYVLGHAIEDAQHHQKITTPDPTPVSVPPAPPPTPIVHSRPPKSPPSAPPPPAPVRHDADEATLPTTDHTELPRRRRRVAVVIPALLGVLLVLAVVFAAGAALWAHRVASQTTASWQPYLEAAKTTAVNLTTINYQTVDADVQRIIDGSTGNFHDQFANRAEQFKDVVRKAQSVSTGTVTGTGVEKLEASQADVLVAVKITSTTKGAAQEARDWRMRITIVKIGDQYKASNVEFVK
jgi:serine/threonine protein kinase, bacterial